MPSPKPNLFPGPDTYPGPADPAPPRARGTADRPHFAWPFQRDVSGQVAVVEQKSLAHIQGQEYAVVVTPIGFREDRPDFGWDWPEFQVLPLDLQNLANAFTRLVPDSRTRIDEWGDKLDVTLRHVRVTNLVQGSGIGVPREEE